MEHKFASTYAGHMNWQDLPLQHWQLNRKLQSRDTLTHR